MEKKKRGRPIGGLGYDETIYKGVKMLYEDEYSTNRGLQERIYASHAIAEIKSHAPEIVCRYELSNGKPKTSILAELGRLKFVYGVDNMIENARECVKLMDEGLTIKEIIKLIRKLRLDKNE